MLMDMLLLVWDKLGQLVSRVGVVSGSELKLISIMIIIDTYGSLPINDFRGVKPLYSTFLYMRHIDQLSPT